MTTVAVSSLPQGTSVTLRNVTKSFGTTKVLNGLDLNIHSGELVALLGPSGCGKSTLLRIIAGFEAADQGSVLLDDVDVSGVPTNRRDIGLVFQAYSLFPHLNAVENVMYGLSIRHVAKTEAKSRAVELLASVGLADYADRYPAQLAGGQQQRVALARALATKPRVLLLDEPLSALDAKVRVQLRDEIRALQLETHTTTIMVTHDQEEALVMADRIAVMYNGRFEQVGTPAEIYHSPATAFVAGFVGSMNVLPGVLSTDGTAQTIGCRVPVRAATSAATLDPGPVDVFVRPEELRLQISNDDLNNRDAVLGIVTSTVLRGAFTSVMVAMGDGLHLRVDLPSKDAQLFAPGCSVMVRIADEPMLCTARRVECVA